MSTTLLCLSLLVFHESRNQPLKGKYAVMEVAENRTKDENFPNDICSVIKQKSQFSWTSNRNNLKVPKHEKEAWDESVKIASDYLSKKTNYTNGAKYFNHSRLGVRFNKKLKCKIGDHVFY